MHSFIEEVIFTVKNKHSDLSKCTFILPSNRAGGFLKYYLKQTSTKTAFAPKIISIEEFLESISGLRKIDAIELLFKGYEAYLQCESITNKESLEIYTSWASTLLNDFNEIDRYLINPKLVFDYFSAIKTLEKWNVQNEKTPLIENYLQFWNNLPEFYERLKDLLTEEGLGYQGMVYRKASEDIEHYIREYGSSTHIFIGFNALNTAEQLVIQELLETGNSEIYWDVDAYFYNDIKHSASSFLRKYTGEWKYYRTNPLTNLANNFQSNKQFRFIEVQKNIGQAKYLGSLLASYSSEELNKTAVILADESLLIPVLSSLPADKGSINITMGISLKLFPAAIFFETLIHQHLNESDSLYYKDVFSILNHPTASLVVDNPQMITHVLLQSNSSYTNLTQLIKIAGPVNKDVINLLFGSWNNSSADSLQNCQNLLLKAKDNTLVSEMDRVVLFKINEIFNRIERLQGTFLQLDSIKTMHNLFQDIIAKTAVNFQGDDYSGLQIMGLLETRVLDFENVIFLSVNEGILPAGTSNASFITHDLKQQFGLPLFTEKDAIFTYHFYSLLHRAKNITLMYNNHSEGLNTGERSRFLLQLEVEQLPNHSIEKQLINPLIETKIKTLKTMSKTPSVQIRLKEIAAKGFSPSALTSYIRNPIDFYFQKILRVTEHKDIEETIAHNTLGTIVHDTLEKFYQPFEGSNLTIDMLEGLKPLIEEEVRFQFKKTYQDGNFSKGKNLIIFEVAKRYILNFIDFEISQLASGHQIKILKIESDLHLSIPMEELDFPVAIAGKVDRVDLFDGVMRIIDFKTGLVKPADLEIIEWGDITQDYKYSKAVQVLAYALMINKEIPIANIEIGIISFKNLFSGFIKFATKAAIRSRDKDYSVTQDTLALYLVELKKLILEICNPSLPFTEKEIEKYDY